MTFWEKLTNDPEYGSARNASPLARAAIGLFLLIIDVHTIVTGEINLGRSNRPNYIYYADHRAVFFFVVVGLSVGAIWAFTNARKRFRMHDR
jgi:uncharacterized membrane protein YidH (DUF202 family)